MTHDQTVSLVLFSIFMIICGVMAIFMVDNWLDNPNLKLRDKVSIIAFSGLGTMALFIGVMGFHTIFR